MSFVSVIVQCFQFGLEFGGVFGYVYLLLFGNRNEKLGKKNVQLIIGYWGMIDFVCCFGQIVSFFVCVVCEGDDFSFEFGLEEKLVYCLGENEDVQVIYVYVVVCFN